MEQWTLYYDGGCNLCHTKQLQMERWASKTGQPLNVDVLQSDVAIAKGYGMDGLVLEINGQPHFGYDGWLESLKVAPWGLSVFYRMRKVRLIRFGAKLLYAIVAKYRLKVFGVRTCQIPPAKS